MFWQSDYRLAVFFIQTSPSRHRRRIEYVDRGNRRAFFLISQREANALGAALMIFTPSQTLDF